MRGGGMPSSSRRSRPKGGGDEFLAAAIDVWKCYDQVKKMLPVKLAIIAGCPPRVIMAYARMHAGLTIRNTVGGKLGEAHMRECGIPQGCPLSSKLLNLIVKVLRNTLKRRGHEVGPQAWQI